MSNYLYDRTKPKKFNRIVANNEAQRRASDENFKLFQLAGMISKLKHLAYTSKNHKKLWECVQILQDEVADIKEVQRKRKEENNKKTIHVKSKQLIGK